ncbi:MULTISPECIES: TlyA family RNA methyltransferase [unclassified Fusibacter]|uniref:TlyA family RNA methyltransferase n=1 Tax=unclassified Fusibacter TaxID=2624464 RepID=UPI00101069C3|nr:MULTISPECIES: TlyA family RNA methyltransferase [unclassified Fusibacter]MCK8058879.1 TlyA family RNA methyltransferase [Fusibacter sp. A2]NPE21954.1 TlyA family RNA methyltransferase [Fusibacter sp. A1]RXV61522.1 TlyA family RNA methyltransferase [Fusibacter sp. A1]
MKERIDVLLVQKGYYETREKAKRALMAGLVFVDGQRFDKPGTKIDSEREIFVKGAAIPYVSRGGLKLEKAIHKFNIELTDSICMDVGASTGGFTDCMLQNGASKVYSIDVGYGQLDWKLRTDERVVNLERTNVRYLSAEQVPEKVDFVSIDVAFISLKLVVPAILSFMNDTCKMVCLIKPQFEAGREQVGKKGVVRDAAVHKEVIVTILTMLKEQGLSIVMLDYSPITGPNGNIEFLAYVTKETVDSIEISTSADQIVEQAHEHLRS